ncbi:MAG: FkbM family methyltransferase [Pirellulales bacterium]
MGLMTKLAASFRKRVLGQRPPLSPNAIKGREYDGQTMELFARVLRRNSCCLDIGAHRGSILKHMLRRSPQGTHHAFEPLPHYAELLRAKYPRAVIHEVATSNRTGTSSFCFVENAPAWSGLQQRLYEVREPKIQPIEVKVARIDDLVPTDLLVRLVKLDIEGGEYHALLGAAATIRRSQPYIVFEAGETSTGQYGVSPDEVFELITHEFGLVLTTMRRWLDDAPPFTASEYRDNWQARGDFYFLAHPQH